MRVPKSISPNPLFTSTIEIRFVTKLNRLELLQKMSSVFTNKFPTLEEGKIPQELKEQEEHFKYSPDYIYKNEDFALAFGTKSISFEHVSEYKFWPTYFEFIKNCLDKILELNFIDKIERCGVRYGSILDGMHKPHEILISVPELMINNLSSDFAGFQSVFKTEISTLFLQISTNAKLEKSGITRSGLYIDIDSSYTKEIIPNREIFDIIDKLHSDQKQLFFGLLNENFIKTLNPQY